MNKKIGSTFEQRKKYRDSGKKIAQPLSGEGFGNTTDQWVIRLLEQEKEKKKKCMNLFFKIFFAFFSLAALIIFIWSKNK